MSWKLPYTNIRIGKDAGPVVNLDKRVPNKGRIGKTVVKRQLIRQKEDVKGWRDATAIAERREIIPDRTDLHRIYKDVILDAHLTALTDTIILGCLAGDFWFADETGKKDDKATAVIQTGWFRDFIKHSIDSMFFGHSLVQFGPIVDDNFDWIKLIPREYVIPDVHSVKMELFVSQDKKNLIDYTLPQFKPWVIEVGKRDDLGILHKATPHALWKKNVTIAWAQYAELFGMPIRVGKTDIRDPERMDNMDTMLSEMGSAAYGIFDPDDELEFVEASNEDAYKVFDFFIDRANSELSKLVLGQTMTTDDGSSKSQADVHADVLTDRVSAIKQFLTDTVQDKLIPLLELHGLITSGLSYVWDDQEKVSLAQKFEQVIELINAGKTVPNKWIVDTFGIPVEDAPDAIPLDQMSNRQKATTVMNEIFNLYKGHVPGDHVHRRERG